METKLYPLDEIETSNPPKTMSQHPYSYDPFVVWASGDQHANATVYSDRLQRDEKFYSSSADVNNGKQFTSTDWCDPSLVQKMLQRFLNNTEVSIVRITQYCNPAYGNAYWRVDYVEVGTKK